MDAPRRTFLKHLASAGTVAPLLGALPAQAGGDSLDDIVRGLAALPTLEQAYFDASDAVIDLKDTYKVGRPFRPKELAWSLTPNVRYQHASYIEPDGDRYSFISGASIERLRTDPELSTGRLFGEGDRILVHGGNDQSLTEAGRQFWAGEDAKGRAQAKSIVDAYDRWKSDCQTYADGIGLTAALALEKETSETFKGEVTRLLALPVSTLQGFALKAKIVRDFDDDAADGLLEELAIFSEAII